MVDLPLLSAPSLQQQLVGHPSANMTLEQLERMSAEQKAKTVLVVQDPFTSYYDARVVADFIRRRKNWAGGRYCYRSRRMVRRSILKVFLIALRKRRKTSEFLNRIAALGMPMVGVDPALVLCYRDEYKLALGEQRGDFHVLLVNEWLAQEINARLSVEVSGEPWYFLVIVRKSRLYPARLRSGPPSLPILARSWKMSA